MGKGLDDRNIDKKIETIVEKTAGNIIESTEDGSVFSKTEVMRRFRDKISAHPDGKESLLKEYEAGHLDRRNFLKIMGFGAGAAVVAGSGAGYFMGENFFGSGSPTGYATRRGISFDRVVNGVDDLGMDPDGNDPIDNILDNNMVSNTLIELPPGRYRVDREHSANVNNFGIVGTGTSHTDAQLFFPNSGSGNPYRFATIEGGNLLLRNWSLDMTDDDYHGVDMWIKGRGNVLMEDMEWLGRAPIEHVNGSDNSRRQHLALDAISGTTIGRRIYMRQSAVIPGYPDGIAGIRVGISTSGTVRVEDSHIEQRGSSAIRSTKMPGAVEYVGGLFKNNDNTNLRLSGGGSGDSFIRDCTVVVDNELNSHANPGDSLTDSEAIRIDSTGEGYSGALIENTHITYTGSARGTAVVFAPTWGEGGSATFRNCRIYNDTSTKTTTLQDVSASPEKVLFVNCQITGDGGDLNSGRDAEIRDSCVSGGFNISGYDLNNVSRSGCEIPSKEERYTQGAASSGGGVGTKTLSISGGSSSDPASYIIKAGSSISRESGNTNDAVFERTATGHLEGSTNTYTVSGGLKEFHAEKSVDVSVDGNSVSRSELLQLMGC